MEDIVIDNALNVLYLELETGKVVIQLRPDLAPNHVKQVKKLTSEKFYDGLVFHRVIDGFMAQTGCPLGTGTGNCGYTIAAEFTDTPHLRGICSMARSSDPDSASSQFFIVLADSPHLNSQYTVWGEVIEGMEYIDQIKKGDPQSGAVEDPDKIISMTLVRDMPITIAR